MLCKRRLSGSWQLATSQRVGGQRVGREGSEHSGQWAGGRQVGSHQSLGWDQHHSRRAERAERRAERAEGGWPAAGLGCWAAGLLGGRASSFVCTAACQLATLIACIALQTGTYRKKKTSTLPSTSSPQHPSPSPRHPFLVLQNHRHLNNPSGESLGPPSSSWPTVASHA